MRGSRQWDGWTMTHICHSKTAVRWSHVRFHLINTSSVLREDRGSLHWSNHNCYFNIKNVNGVCELHAGVAPKQTLGISLRYDHVCLIFGDSSQVSLSPRRLGWSSFDSCSVLPLWRLLWVSELLKGWSSRAKEGTEQRTDIVTGTFYSPSQHRLIRVLTQTLGQDLKLHYTSVC